MYNYSGPLFLGIDYGTTRVKASIITEDETVLTTYTISWNEADCSKFFLSDWLKILKKIINEVLKQPGIDSRLLSSVAITTMSPCVVLIDPHSEYSSSPIILYDEVLSMDKIESRIDRINASIKILSAFTPSTSKARNLILTANAWLVWQLTGELVIDEYSLLDILGDSKEQEIEGAQFPEKILTPTTIAGTIKRKWAKILDIPLSVKVCCGGTDTVALVRATKLKTNEHLIYLGTFFSVLEAKLDFSKGIPKNLVPPPYTWHISLEGGALIERLAASYFPLEENRSDQISRYLEIARNNLRVDNEKIRRIVKKKWTLGKPVQMLPELSSPKDANNTLSELTVIPFISFAQALESYFTDKRGEGVVHVVGGLSPNEWIAEFLRESVNRPCSSKINIHGAEGAALLAKDGIYDI